MRFQFGRIGRATALGLAAGQPAGSGQQQAAVVLLDRKIKTTGSPFDVLLWDGQIEPHQHAAALIYAKLRRKAASLGFARMRDALPKQHADHEAALRLAGFDRFALDRLAIEGLEPVGAELNRLPHCPS